MEANGLHVHPIVEAKRDEVLALCKKHKVRRLALFGSAAASEFDPERSDFDFIVEYEPQEPVLLADNYFGLLFGLEELFHRHIDLIEGRAIKNPFFLKAVKDTQVVLYEAA